MYISTIHKQIYGRFRKEAKFGNRINISQINPILKWHIRFPAPTRVEIIKELIKMKLLKKIDRDNYELITTIDFKPCNDSLGRPLW